MVAIKECINSLDKGVGAYLLGYCKADLAKGDDIDLLTISEEFACEVLELTPCLLD